MREPLYLGTPEAEESDQHILEEFGEMGNSCGDLHYPPLLKHVVLLTPVRTCSPEGVGVIFESGFDACLPPGIYIFSKIIETTRHGPRYLEGMSVEGKEVKICIGQPESITIDWRGAERK